MKADIVGHFMEAFKKYENSFNLYICPQGWMSLYHPFHAVWGN